MLSPLFAGSLNQNATTNYEAVYTFALIATLVTAFFIYKTSNIPYQLAHRKSMIYARIFAPVLGLIVGIYGYIYNDQVTYLITVPVFLTIVMEVLISIWIWHELNIYTGKHRRMFNKRTNTVLVIVALILAAGLLIRSVSFFIENEADEKRQKAYDECMIKRHGSKYKLSPWLESGGPCDNRPGVN